MAQDTMFRVNQLSKDLGMKSSKELILFLEGVGISDKKSSSVLSADEFNAFFNELTMQNQISDIDGKDESRRDGARRRKRRRSRERRCGCRA